jgi:hypothetical protein
MGMVARELQIGDFVLVDGTPRRVEAITKKKIGYHRKEDEPRLYYARLRDVEPIEITEEFITKIGFDIEKNLNGWYQARMRTNGFSVYFCATRPNEWDWEKTLEISHSPLREPYLRKTVTYLHELQHAFKLCGIYFEVKL